MVTHDNHLISTFAERLSWFRLLSTRITVLVLFLILLDTALRFVVGLHLGASLVNILVSRVPTFLYWRIFSANKDSIVVSYLGSILVEFHASKIGLTIHVELVSLKFRGFKVPNSAIAKENLSRAITSNFLERLVYVTLAVELFGLDLVSQKGVVIVDSNCAIHKSTLNSTIEELFDV